MLYNQSVEIQFLEAAQRLPVDHSQLDTFLQLEYRFLHYDDHKSLLLGSIDIYLIRLFQTKAKESFKES